MPAFAATSSLERPDSKSVCICFPAASPHAVTASMALVCFSLYPPIEAVVSSNDLGRSATESLTPWRASPRASALDTCSSVFAVSSAVLNPLDASALWSAAMAYNPNDPLVAFN